MENGQRTAPSDPNNAICNGHPPGAHVDLTRRYYERKLRSLSFPGKSLCCSRSCCVGGIAVLRSSAWVTRSVQIAVAVIVRGKASSQAGSR